MRHNQVTDRQTTMTFVSITPEGKQRILDLHSTGLGRNEIHRQLQKENIRASRAFITVFLKKHESSLQHNPTYAENMQSNAVFMQTESTPIDREPQKNQPNPNINNEMKYLNNQDETINEEKPYQHRITPSAPPYTSSHSRNSQIEARIRGELTTKIRSELEAQVRTETEAVFTEINDMRHRAFHEANNARNKNKQKEQQLQQKEYDLNAKVVIWRPLLPFIEEAVKTGLLPIDLKMWIHSRQKIERIEKVDSETAAILLCQRFEQNLELSNIEKRLAMGQTALRMQEMTMLQNQIEIFRSGNGFNPGQQAITEPQPQQIFPPPDKQTISPQQIAAIQNLIKQAHNDHSQDRNMRQYLLKI